MLGSDITATAAGMLAAHFAAPSPVRLSFAGTYSDHMVLQQAPYQATIWGFAPSDSPVTLRLINTLSGYAAVLSADLAPFNSSAFSWKLALPSTPASDTPYNLSLDQQGTGITIHDVLFGEVWVCSGQSNMAFLVEMAFGGAEFVQDANNHPTIRLSVPLRLPC